MNGWTEMIPVSTRKIKNGFRMFIDLCVGEF